MNHSGMLFASSLCNNNYIIFIIKYKKFMTDNYSSWRSLNGVLAVTLGLLSGCATLQSAEEDRDPLEGINRAIYSFNENVDKVVVKPLATVYRDAIPEFVRTGVGNFFGNLAYPIVIANDMLQGKITQGLDDTSRFMTNSTFGLLGFLDVATPAGMPAQNEDFGQTLGVWGFGEGVYIVLPFLGPSNLRDTVGLVADYQVDLLNYRSDMSQRNVARGVRAIDTRSRLLGATRVFEEAAALDPYTFARDAYRQRRANLIRDGGGAPADEFFEEEPPAP
jgi:phospholipid-binding lipoprotein MlaA